MLFRSAAATQMGVTISPKLIVQLEGDSPSPQLGYKVTKRLVATREPFTALFAFNDISAMGAIRALRESGLQVPDDVSVIGFDDIPAAAFYNPALTSVREHMESLASIGAEILMEAIRAHRMNTTVSPVHRKIKPELIVRESTAPLS